MATISKLGLAERDAILTHPDCTKSSAPLSPVTHLEDEKIKKNDKVFLFDLIILRLDITQKTIDQFTKLLVEANVNGRNLNITSSRINVLDFQPERSIEFVVNPVKLKEQLTINPLTVKITDMADIIGYGVLEWPKEFLSAVIECDREVTNTFEIDIKKCDGTKTGVMQIYLRLQPKCKDFEEDISQDEKCCHVNKDIEANDVLFMVGARKNTCCCSQIDIVQASDSGSDLMVKYLDLQSFHAVSNTDHLASLDTECPKLTSATNHYRNLISELKSKKTRSSAIRKTGKEKGEIFYLLPSESSLNPTTFSSNSASKRMGKLCLLDKAFSAKPAKKIHIGEPAPKLLQNEVHSLRKCPLCKENLKYLPKLAACPNCCYKPMPHFEEKLYDDSQNADKILKQFHDNLRTNNNSLSDVNTKESPKSRCTCQFRSNKPCAHCRIRKLCEHMFHPQPAVQCQDIAESKSSDIHCVSSSDNRPFLTRIFSEFKNIYDIPEPIVKNIEHNERFEDYLNEKPCGVKKVIKTPMQIVEAKQTKKSEKRKKCSAKPIRKSKLYDYQYVRQNRANKLGHKTCVNGYGGYKNVPRNMGWLWNIENYGKWKPGAIRKPIKELMRYFLKDFPADTLLVSQYAYRKMSKSRNLDDAALKSLVQKPTLHIQKKDAMYIITMRPLKRSEVLHDSPDPYENMQPIQFRIVKNPQLERIRNLKKSLKSMGFKKCSCHRPITYCYCRNFIDKSRLEYHCKKECNRRQIEPCCDTLVLSDTSDSESEFDFGVTPPIGVIKPKKLKKINLIHVSTQYDELDWNPVPLFPRPSNKYMNMYQCAVGERKAIPITGEINSDEGEIGMKAVGGILNKGAFAKEMSRYTGGTGKSKIVGIGASGATVMGLRAAEMMGKGAATKSGFASGRPGGAVAGIGKGVVKRSGATTAMGKGMATGIGGAGVIGKGIATRGGLTGARGGGDGFLVGKEITKRGVVALDLQGRVVSAPKEKSENTSKKKVDMLKYVVKMNKKAAKISPADAAAKRKEKMTLLKGVNPPLLCMIDRRGKPFDPCAPCLPCDDYRVC